MSEAEKFHDALMLKEKKYSIHIYQDFKKKYMIELRKFNQFYCDGAAENLNIVIETLETNLDKWAFFLIYGHRIDNEVSEKIQDAFVIKAVKALQCIELSKDEKLYLDALITRERDIFSHLQYIKRIREENRIVEFLHKMALTFLDCNFKINQIAKLLKLEEDDVEELL